MKKLIVFLCALVTLALLSPLHALDAAKEYEIKAAFLFNLGAFVHWPAGTFAHPNAPFYLCVIGNDPFGESLDVIAAGRTIAEHPVAVRRLKKISEADSCRVLFISASERTNLHTIFEFLRGKPVLTVGDVSEFAVNGGMVQFFSRNNKIRLMLDPETFAEAGLKPSDHLMRITQDRD